LEQVGYCKTGRPSGAMSTSRLRGRPGVREGAPGVPGPAASGEHSARWLWRTAAGRLGPV